jgi:hypothetical protein
MLSQKSERKGKELCFPDPKKRLATNPDPPYPYVELLDPYSDLDLKGTQE